MKKEEKKEVIEKKENTITKEEELRRKKVLKSFKIFMIIFDVLALLNLVLQLYMKDVMWSTYVVLLISNIVVFVACKYGEKAN